MKGFVYLIEVAIAGLIVALALAAFLATTTFRTSWERPDLVSLGDSVLWSISDSNQMLKILDGNTTNVTAVLPFNVKWGMHVAGTPKTNMKIGCICGFSDYTLVSNALEPTYVNRRWVNYTVDQLDQSSWPDTADNYDALIFTIPIDFDGNASVQNYLTKGKGIIALMRMDNARLANMDQTFGLARTIMFGPDMLPFVQYSPDTNKIPKYFFGFGMPVKMTGTIDGKQTGTWTIWEADKQVNITTDSPPRVEVKDASPSNVREGETFTLTGPDSLAYSFKVKKVWPDVSGAIMQPVVPNFKFRNFAADDIINVTGNINIVGGTSGSAVTANGTAIWLSDWARPSSEYGAVLRAAVASLTTEWWLKEPVSPMEPVTAFSFVPLCCDMPETVEVVLWLWYAF